MSTAARAATRDWPTASGGEAGEVRTAAFRAKRMARIESLSRPPWGHTTAASSHGRANRAKAKDTDDGAGRIRKHRRSTTRTREATMPKKPGSPDTTMQTGGACGSFRL